MNRARLGNVILLRKNVRAHRFWKSARAEIYLKISLQISHFVLEKVIPGDNFGRPFAWCEKLVKNNC